MQTSTPTPFTKAPAALAAATAVAIAIMAAILAGCNPDPTPPPDDSATPETIAAQIRPTLAPLQTLLATPSQHNGNFNLIDPEWSRSIADQLKQARDTWSSSKNGQAALDKIAGELQQLIIRAKDEDRWGLVLCAIQIHEQLRPGAQLMRLLRNRALLHAARPHVVVKGFFDDNDTNELYVFMRVTLRAGYQPHPPSAQPAAETAPETAPEGEAEGEPQADAPPVAVPPAASHLEQDEVHMVQVRLNEEFYGLRLADIVGNKRGVVLEYLADPGHFFQVMVPPRKFGPPRNTNPAAGMRPKRRVRR